MRAKSFLLLLCLADIASGAVIDSDYANGGWTIDASLPIRGGTFRAQDQLLQSFTVSFLMQSDAHPVNVFVGGTDDNGAPDGSRLWESGQFPSAVQKFTFTPNLAVMPNDYYFIGIQVINPVPDVSSHTFVRFGVTYSQPRYEIEGNVWDYDSDGILSPVTYADIASTITMTPVPEPSVVAFLTLMVIPLGYFFFRNPQSRLRS